MAMRKSKCLFCKTGTVYNMECTKVIGHVWCDIDAYSEGISCTPDGCYYYTKGQQEYEKGKVQHEQ